MLYALPIDGEILIYLDTRVHDRHHVESLLPEVGDQPSGVGKPLAVESEGTEAIHVVDVQVDSVTWNPPATELAGNPPDFFLGVVGIAGLVVPQCPLWRERHPSRQACVQVQD